MEEMGEEKKGREGKGKDGKRGRREQREWEGRWKGKKGIPGKSKNRIIKERGKKMKRE